MVLADGRTVVREALLAGLAPEPEITVSEWADQYRILDRAGAKEFGRYRIERTPYMREPMDCLSVHSPVTRLTIKKGAQVGATEVLNNLLGYIVDVSPGPVLMIMPTRELSQRAAKQRIDPMFASTPSLASKVSVCRSRDADNSMSYKGFPGGALALAGANSAASFRSMPCRYVLLDEVDAYPGDVDGEGDPVSLALRGTRTYGDTAKAALVSTPTIAGRSRISDSFEESDQRYYHVPCPFCGELQKIEWKRIRYKDKDPSTAALECIACEHLIEEHHKTSMLARGVWIPEEPDRSDEHRGYHISALYSPIGWRSWSDVVAEFLKAKKRPDRLRVWVNQDLGEEWEEKGETPRWQRLYNRRELYKMGTVPEGGIVLTAGVDVQANRLEVEIVAWAEEEESWSIDYQVLLGDTDQPDVWKDLDDVVGRTYKHALGADLPVLAVGIDSGYRTQEVYAYCRARPVRKFMAMKGRDQTQLVVSQPRLVDITLRGEKIPNGVHLRIVGVGQLKQQLYSFLRQEQPVDTSQGWPRGWAHFPQHGEDYFKQLCSEQLVARIVKGYPKYSWEKHPDVRNEGLDCRVYARAAAEVLGISRWGQNQWSHRKQMLGAGVAAQPSKAQLQRQRRAARRRD